MKNQGTCKLLLLLAAMMGLALAGCDQATPTKTVNTVDQIQEASAPTLILTTPLAAGTQCPAGGTQVDVGQDANKNGELDKDEITNTSYICNGLAATLGDEIMAVSDLEVGDVNCPNGGQRVDSGLDTDGDGALDAVEVTTTAFVCDKLQEKWPTATRIVPINPPAAPAAAYTINTSGGSGGSSGYGGALDIYLEGSNGGHIKLFNTGKAQADWVMPTPPVANLGITPLVVNTGKVSVSFHPSGDDTAVAEGGFHLHDLDSSMYQRISGVDRIVTGISVSAGATLEFNTNNANIYIPGDLVSYGTLTTPRDNRIDLNLSAEMIHLGTGSQIDQTGYYDSITGNVYSPGSLSLSAGRKLYNEGLINTSAAEKSGGVSGTVSLRGNTGLYNTGDILSIGGSRDVVSGNRGGTAGSIYLNNSQWGPLYNSGTITCRGGYPGGSSQTIRIQNENGDIRNTGNLNTSGADGHGYAISGGNGANIILSAIDGSLYNSGDLTARGGYGAYNTGGNGGEVHIYTDRWNTTPAQNWSQAGSIHLSGNIDTRGGNTKSQIDDGGIGAGVYINVSHQNTPAQQEVILYGYSAITLSGGDGNPGYNYWGNGDGGSFYAQNSSSYGIDNEAYPSGSVINYVPITSKGGSSLNLNGYGGAGGGVTMRIDSLFPWLENQVVYSLAPININGGSGSTGGNGGAIDLRGATGLEIRAPISSKGGVGWLNGGGTSCDWGSSIFSKGYLINTADLMLSGGDGVLDNAGQGCLLEMIAWGDLTNTGSINLNGGNVPLDVILEGGTGGDLVMTSLQGTLNNSGTITASGGEGTPIGLDGTITLNGLLH